MKRTRLARILALCCLLGLVVLCGRLSGPHPRVDEATLEKITPGMDLDEVVRFIGCAPGDSSKGGVETVGYELFGKGYTLNEWRFDAVTIAVWTKGNTVYGVETNTPMRKQNRVLSWIKNVLR